ncbi:LAFE_0H12178g1_1 [Lachancea fermentati]|uniref:LAFE_0H12178g1_1 n=1 Tax=Lachancea fermentati TaxID=4955 RepID=A0A1G4MKH8_LACFM|nr:LAFE_0H12178g1_1 [Lachancea fermentati]
MVVEDQDSEVSQLTFSFGELELRDSNTGPKETQNEKQYHQNQIQGPFVPNPLQGLVPQEICSLALQEKENMQETSQSSGDLRSASVIDDSVTEARSASETVFAKLKNENYHLRLELTQKAQEVEGLQQKLQHFTEDPKSKSLAMPPKLGPYRVSRAAHPNLSPTRLSIENASDVDIATHFSESPYKSRSSSRQKPISTTSSEFAQVHSRQKLLLYSIVPYVERTIDAFQCSEVFGDDAKDSREKFQAFMSVDISWEQKIKLMAEVLDDLIYLQRQCIALLNRELQVKKVSSQLEFLFTVFLDPDEYGIMKQEHVSKLKKEMMDILVNLFDYDVDNSKSHTTEASSNELLQKLKKRDKTDPLYKVKKTQKIQTGLDICTDALQKYSALQFQNLKKQSRQSENTSPIVLEPNDSRRRKKSLEFIPIGYDEAMLADTPPKNVSKRQLQLKSKSSHASMLHRLKQEGQVENDPLQLFFSEFLDDAASCMNVDKAKSTVPSYTNI